MTNIIPLFVRGRAARARETDVESMSSEEKEKWKIESYRVRQEKFLKITLKPISR